MSTNSKKLPTLTLRRQFRTKPQAESVKNTIDEGLPALRPDEYTVLFTKMESLDASNHALIAASQVVDQARTDFLAAEAALKEAEDDLRAVKEEHQTALREATPLLDRLPTV